MPVILATQEAEIRRIIVRSQPRQIVQETLSQKTLHKKGLAQNNNNKILIYDTLCFMTKTTYSIIPFI
jgi:hypothetical protein